MSTDNYHCKDILNCSTAKNIDLSVWIPTFVALVDELESLINSFSSANVQRPESIFQEMLSQAKENAATIGCSHLSELLAHEDLKNPHTRDQGLGVIKKIIDALMMNKTILEKTVNLFSNTFVKEFCIETL